MCPQGLILQAISRNEGQFLINRTDSAFLIFYLPFVWTYPAVRYVLYVTIRVFFLIGNTQWKYPLKRALI